MQRVKGMIRAAKNIYLKKRHIEIKFTPVEVEIQNNYFVCEESVLMSEVTTRRASD